MTEDILQGINPTRMELLQLRKRRSLAEKGHKLLTEKRDALISEFFKILEDRKDIRSGFETDLMHAYIKAREAEMVTGRENLKLIAQSAPKNLALEAARDNIMGVPVPQLKYSRQELDGPKYGFLDTNALVDETSHKFQDISERMMRLAEIEGRISELALDIEKTKRRVNALEHIFIPQMKATEKYIEMQLEEIEREDFFRRKRIKAILGGDEHTG